MKLNLHVGRPTSFKAREGDGGNQMYVGILIAKPNYGFTCPRFKTAGHAGNEGCEPVGDGCTYKVIDIFTSLGFRSGGIFGPDEAAAVEALELFSGTLCFAAYQFVGVHFREYMNGTMQSYVDADNLTSIAPYAFAGETSLESVSLPSLTLLPDYCFANTPALETVSLPSVLAANSNVFSYSSAMEVLRLPEMTLLNSVSALVSNMSALKELRIPKLTTTPSSGAVSVCSSLEVLDLGLVTAVGLQISSTYMSKLRYLILRNTTSVVTSGNAPNSSSPIGKKTYAYILVPRSMVDSYKADSFWGPYASIIAAIEDHPEICT